MCLKQDASPSELKQGSVRKAWNQPFSVNAQWWQNSEQGNSRELFNNFLVFYFYILHRDLYSLQQCKI